MHFLRSLICAKGGRYCRLTLAGRPERLPSRNLEESKGYPRALRRTSHRQSKAGTRVNSVPA